MALVPGDSTVGECTSLVLDAQPEGVDAALEFGRRLGAIARPPGTGSTRDLWESLASLAAIDLGAARAIEPHLDALAILAHADALPSDAQAATWGVFAAEGGEHPLTANNASGVWRLTGIKPWCSLAGRLDRALVTAHLPDGGRGLFAVDLRLPGPVVVEGAWHPRGLVEIPSGPLEFEDVLAVPVGGRDWYLDRPGFAWGGIGVAACWYGGAVGIARTVFENLGAEPSPILAMHLGRLDTLLQSARRALAEAAEEVDAAGAGDSSSSDGSILAKRARAVVAETCEGVIHIAGHALGPAPLAQDERHAKRVADLQLYIRQHHAEKDDASLGTSLAAAGVAPW